MAILKKHIQFYREIFMIPGMFSEPFLMIGYQEIVQKNDMPDEFRCQDVKELFTRRGAKMIKVLDFFDSRSDLKYDLNSPVPDCEHQAYQVVFDIGTLEHVFDTRQCLENCLRMVKVGGLYFLHTPVNGYFRHGLHVFNPDGLIDALQLNHFEILYLKYCTRDGVEIKDPADGEDVIFWTVARKTRESGGFIVPQQRSYVARSKSPNNDEQNRSVSLIKLPVYIVLRAIWHLLFSIKRKLRRLLG